MSAAPNLLALGDAYRDDSVAGGFASRAAQAHLRVAADALSMALLTLQGRGDREQRAAQARGFLLEAVTGLSRARIYLPQIRSHSRAVLMDCDHDAGAELARLHQIATRLLWQNHAHLPARLQAKPLPPDEEAQLAVVFAGLARTERIDRALRYKWPALLVAFAIAGHTVGFPIVSVAAATLALMLALWRVARR